MDVASVEALTMLYFTFVVNNTILSSLYSLLNTNEK